MISIEISGIVDMRDERFVSDGSQLTGSFRENFLAVGRIGSLRKIAA
jgi:hypothetical protein